MFSHNATFVLCHSYTKTHVHLLDFKNENLEQLMGIDSKA